MSRSSSFARALPFRRRPFRAQIVVLVGALLALSVGLSGLGTPAGATDWSSVPGATSSDLIVSPANYLGQPQDPGFSYTNRPNGAADYCAITDAAATYPCPIADYRKYFRIDSSEATTLGAVFHLTMINPALTQAGFEADSNGYWQQVFTNSSHGWLWNAPVSGTQVGQSSYSETFCALNVPCTVSFSLRDNYGLYGGNQFVVANMVGQTGGAIGSTFLPLHPVAPPTPPKVDFTASPGDAALTETFSATATATPPATISSYSWDFGDGTTGSGQTPNHTFRAAGTYHVTVTAKDSNGLQATVGRDVVVDVKLVVNSVADTPNAAGSGRSCDTGATVGEPAVPECTLRAALQAANAGTGAQSITFAIPGVAGIPTIPVGSDLPASTVPVSIDGTTQPGGWVELSADGSINGVRLAADRSLVKGIVFDGFASALLAGANTPGDHSGDTVTGNRFGVDAAGAAVTHQPATAVLTANVTDIAISDNVMSASAFGIQAILGSTGTISGNRIGVTADGSAGLKPLPQDSIGLSGVGAFAVRDNTLAAQTTAVWLHGASSAGTSITGNHIGTNSAGMARLGTFGLGVFVDGVSGVTVNDNVIATSRGTNSETADVIVTGIAQCTADGCKGPNAALGGPITGGNLTVRGNDLGVLSTGATAGAAGAYGVLVYGKAPNVTIDSNVIAGHFQVGAQVAEVELVGTTNAIVASNTIGTNAAGTAVIRADVGVDVAGATGTTVLGNLIGGASTAGVLVHAFGSGAPIVESSKTEIHDNKIGVNRAGTAALSNQVGVLVTDGSSDTSVGPNNTISGNTAAGLQISKTAAGTEVDADGIGVDQAGRAAIPNGVGVDVSDLAAGTDVMSSLIAGNTGAGIRTTSANLVTVLRSEIGRHSQGVVIPNGVGVDAQGPATLAIDTVQGNLGSGVISAPNMPVAILGSTTFSDNGDVGIVSPGDPVAPTIDPVITTSASGRKHVTFVVTAGSPGTLAGVAIYANADCSQPGSAQKIVATTSAYSKDASTFLARQTSDVLAGGYTATAILVTQTGPPDAAKPIGRTSAISACVVPHAYPDTSGTGVPDIIQKATGGNPARPNTVTFLGADGHPVGLVASQGRFTDVAQTDAADVPALPAGVSLPSGPFTFTVTGLRVGSAVSVSVVSHAVDSGQVNAYWRYGSPTSAAPPQWYPWDYDPATGVGAQRDGHFLTLEFIDGYAGDDDATANGTVVDPGAPAVDTRPAAPSPASTTTAAPATPTPTPSSSGGGSAGAGALPRTGFDLRPWTITATALIVLGLLTTLAGRCVIPRRRRRG